MTKDHASAPRSVAEIREDVARARARLSEAVSDLVDEEHPSNVIARKTRAAKQWIDERVRSVEACLRDESGWRADRLSVVGAAIAGLVALAVVLRRISRRGGDAAGSDGFAVS